jgi:hypothetical protein
VKEKKGFNAKKIMKIAGMVVGAFIILFIGAGIGSSGAEITLDEKKVDAVALDKEIAKLEDKKTGLSEDVKSIQSEYDEAKKLVDSKNEVESKLKEAEAKLKDKESALEKELADGRKEIDKELSDINKQLKDKKSELNSTEKKLASVSGQLKKAKGEPKVLGAGTYIVGNDVPASRYLATPTGEGSNFFVNDGRKVNTILGSYGEDSYTFFAEEGDTIQTEAEVKLTPVE